jgi:hypothetical protein
MVDYYPRRSRLIFQADVFPAHGRVPTNLAEVIERDRDIRYSSRTRLITNNLRENTICDTPSTSCTNYCPQSSPSLNRPGDFMPMAV